jgi:SAM-dependent methyltransferase
VIDQGKQLTGRDWSGPDPRYRGYRPARRGVHLDHRVRVARSLLPQAGGVLVDLGGGDGYLTSVFATTTRARTAVAVDTGFAPPLAALERPVHRVRAQLPSLPVRSGTADVVVCLEVIEHLLDPDELLEEIRRVLSPGGTVVLSTPRLDSLLVVGSLLLGQQPPGVEASSRVRYGSPLSDGRPSGHLHLFTRRALREALAAHHLAIDVLREARFSSSWWQSVRVAGPPSSVDLVLAAGFGLYDLVPFRKDVMVVRAHPLRG